MKIIFKSIIILLFITISANSEIIKEIKVSGNKRVSSETIKIFSEININKDLSTNQLNDVIKKLYSTNFFSNVGINVKKNILYISVVENPVIQTLKFEGVKNKRIIKLLKEQIEMREKSSFIEINVKNDVEKIINILRTNGFYFSKVIPKLKKNNNNTVDLIFQIELGDKAYIKKITFIGDKKIKENKLKKIIVSEETKFWKFVSSRKFLDLNRIKLDEKLLYNFYKNKGYYNISVESSSAKVINESNFELIFNINAGKKYYFGKIDLIIPDEYSPESFKKIIDVQDKLEGKIYSLDKIKKILNKIDEIALTKEFEFINAKYKENIVNNNINLLIKLEESQKFYIERINVLGNYITNENVIRNFLLVDEGDAFNEILVNKSINEIKSGRLFKSVNKSVDNGSSNELKIININVEEQPTGELFAGAGTGTSGSSISFGIKENNYLGKGVKLDANASISNTSMLGSFTINNPNYKNSDKSLSTSIESTKIDQMAKFGYKSTKTGFSIGTVFEQYEDIYFSPSISNYLETLKTSSAASDAKKKQKGDYFDSNFNYGISLNKLNQNFQPSAGYKSEFYQSLPLYSDDLSIRNKYNFAKYYSPNENAILSFRFLVQSINSLSGEDVRISKRIYLPSKRLKGFEFGKIGPKDGQDYIGGNYATALNFATTLPGIFKDLETIDFSFFVDAGNVWGVDYSDTINDNSKIRTSIGLAVDWLTPIGPLSFSFAKPITKADTDKTETFRFDIGTTF
jgi:outer membrane protein insertion porin family